MESLLIASSDRTNISIFYNTLQHYTKGEGYYVNELEEKLENVKKIMNDINKICFNEKINKESKKYISVYDYIGVLFYLEGSYKDAEEMFEISRVFKKNLFENKIINIEEYNIYMIITLFNLIEVYDVFQMKDKEYLRNLNKKIMELISCKYAEEKAIFIYYISLTEYLTEPSINNFKNFESFKQEDELIKSQTFKNFWNFKKYCLYAKYYERNDHKLAFNYYQRIVEMFENINLIKGEYYLKATIQCADYLILSNSKNASHIDFKLLRNYLNNGLNYLKEQKNLNYISDVKIAKYKVCILNKLIYIEILEKTPLNSKEYLEEIDNIFENFKFENATNMKIIYLNNKMMVMDHLLNQKECSKTIDDILKLLQIDLGPAYKNITILNNICSIINVDGYFFDIKTLLKKLSPEERKAILNKNIPNMITYNHNLIMENADIITDDIKMVNILKRLHSIDDFKIDNFDELYAANFLYNYLVVSEQNSDMNLGLIYNIKDFPKDEILSVLYKKSLSSFEFISKNNLELFLNIVYKYSFNKYLKRAYQESLDATNQAILFLDNSKKYNDSYKNLLRYSDLQKLAGDNNFLMKRFDESLTNYKKSYDIYDKLKGEKEKAIVSFNIGLISIFHLKDDKEAVKNLERAMRNFSKVNDTKSVGKAKELLDIINMKE